jgi:opacity protein-like surface antigen
MSRAIAGVLAFLSVALVAAVPAPARASGLEGRLGGFAPQADSTLFHDDAELYTVAKRDWRGFTGGVEYSFGLAPHLEMGIHVDGYGRTHPTVYRDFERDNGAEIRQNLRLNLVPVGVSLRILPFRDRAPVSPYVTVGADVIAYHYEEFGDFIDFQSRGLDISADSFTSNGAAFGYHVAGGLRVPIGHDFALTGEVRYQGAQKPRMEDDFSELHIDLSGVSATVGVRLRF